MAQAKLGPSFRRQVGRSAGIHSLSVPSLTPSSCPAGSATTGVPTPYATLRSTPLRGTASASSFGRGSLHATPHQKSFQGSLSWSNSPSRASSSRSGLLDRTPPVCSPTARRASGSPGTSRYGAEDDRLLLAPLAERAARLGSTEADILVPTREPWQWPPQAEATPQADGDIWEALERRTEALQEARERSLRLLEQRARSLRWQAYANGGVEEELKLTGSRFTDKADERRTLTRGLQEPRRSTRQGRSAAEAEARRAARAAAEAAAEFHQTRANWEERLQSAMAERDLLQAQLASEQAAHQGSRQAWMLAVKVADLKKRSVSFADTHQAEDTSHTKDGASGVVSMATIYDSSGHKNIVIDLGEGEVEAPRWISEAPMWAAAPQPAIEAVEATA